MSPHREQPLERVGVVRGGGGVGWDGKGGKRGGVGKRCWEGEVRGGNKEVEGEQ